jgi:hypothetical protein
MPSHMVKVTALFPLVLKVGIQTKDVLAHVFFVFSFAIYDNCGIVPMVNKKSPDDRGFSTHDTEFRSCNA